MRTINIVRKVTETEQVEITLPLYAMVEDDDGRTYVKISEGYFTSLKVTHYTNEHTFDRFKASPNSISEIWFNNQIKVDDFNYVLESAKKSLQDVYRNE